MYLVQTVLLSSSKTFYGDIIKNVPSARNQVKSMKSEAELLLPSTHEVPRGLQERILAMMNRDEFSILARNDQLITSAVR